MILYQLRCVHDHEFEAWFRSSASYDEQVAAGDVECPFCGETRMSKAPMAPHLASRSLRDLDKMPAAGVNGEEQRAQDLARQILKAVDKLREHVEENFEDVGEDFAREARRIHAGEAEDRGIYGTASEDDAHALDDEEIEYFRVPVSARRDG